MIVEVKRYGMRTEFFADIEDQIVGGRDLIKAEAVRHWHAGIERLGFVPYGEPEVRIVREVVPMVDVNPETGEEFRLPDSCCVVTGSVVPTGTPMPSA